MVKPIRYSDHLTMRIKWRRVPKTLPRKIYKQARERYVDRVTGLHIAVATIPYRGRKREFALVYKETAGEILLVTIHPLKLRQKLNRLERGRWRKLPKINE